MHRVVAAVAALALAACSSGTATTSTDAPETSAPTSTTVPPLPDGAYFAFLRSFDGGTLVFDPAEMLSGEEAREAAVEDGVIEEGETLDNDFYIRNPDETTVSLPLAADAAIRLLGFGPDGGIIEVDFAPEDLAAVLAGDLGDQVYGVVPGELPANVHVHEGRLTEVSQQYLP